MLSQRVVNYWDPRTDRGFDWKHYVLMALSAVLLVAGGFSGGWFTRGRVDQAGGFLPAPVTKPVFVSLGAAPSPASFSLRRYVPPLPNQGLDDSCNSCSAAIAIGTAWAYAGHPKVQMSCEYLWQPVVGYVNRGTSFDEIYNTLETNGMATDQEWPTSVGQSEFGVGHFAPASVIADARQRRIRNWFAVSPTDQTTIKSLLYSGRPVQIALNVPYSLVYSNNGVGTVSYGSGAIQFQHVMSVVGWTPAGLLFAGTWGPAWGLDGYSVLSWGFIAAYEEGPDSGVGFNPAFSMMRPMPHLVKFPVHAWQRYGRYGHVAHGHLIPTARFWLKHRWLGAPVSRLHVFPRSKHRHEYAQQTFRGVHRHHRRYRVTVWPGTRWRARVKRL